MEKKTKTKNTIRPVRLHLRKSKNRSQNKKKMCSVFETVGQLEFQANLRETFAV